VELPDMATESNTKPRAFHRVIRFLASLKLAVILMVALAAVLSVATVLEANHDMAYAHWYVYKSHWFSGLLGALGVNIFAAAAARYPWKRHQTGFVVTHAGLLVLLAGAILSFLGGVEGQISLVEGETVKRLTLPERSQITAVWDGRPGEAPYEFAFDGGPVDWNSDRTLEIGEVDGISAKILRFYRYAQPKSEWVARADEGAPLVKFRVTGPGGKLVAEHFLADERFGEALLVGPIRVQLQRAANRAMLAEFQNPAPRAPSDDGLLTACFQDVVEQILVKGNTGQKFAIGNTGASVEIVEYLPNARPEQMGRFVTKGDEPKNPMLELRVHLPDEKAPIRQVAFAKDALLNLDGVYARQCPVKFRYRHAAVKTEPTVEFLQAADGTLHGRTFSDGQPGFSGVVTGGTKLPVGMRFELTVTDYLPHAENKLSFEPAAAATKNRPEPAALVEIRSGDAARQVWLQRNDLHYGLRKVIMPEGSLLVRYGYGELPLGFALKLEDFRREVNPGRTGDAAFASQVRVIDEEMEWEESHEISMNEPLTHRRYTFYQSGFNEGEHGRESSVLSVGYDPGRPVKYLGSLMICTGIAIMFYMRAYFFKRSRGEHDATVESSPVPVAADPVDSTVRAIPVTSIAASAATLDQHPSGRAA
jgi:hypothetical protein